MKLLIGIPAFNESDVLNSVLESLPRQIPGISLIETLVVNDGSTDSTEETALKHNVTVVSHLINRGLGGAIKTILRYGKLNNFDYVLTFDADGQHVSGDISRLIAKQKKDNADVVIGSRWLEKAEAPLSRKFINSIANHFTFLIYGVATSDSQSGLRLFNRNAIEKIDLKFDRMEVSSEVFGEIRRNHLKYTEIPIKSIYTDYSLRKGQKISNSVEIFIKLLIQVLTK